jgi:outer membrane receptor protein involved in Fe transport
MANIDTKLFGKDLRGNLGVRYEHTHQNVLANSVDGDGTCWARDTRCRTMAMSCPAPTSRWM